MWWIVQASIQRKVKHIWGKVKKGEENNKLFEIVKGGGKKPYLWWWPCRREIPCPRTLGLKWFHGTPIAVCCSLLQVFAVRWCYGTPVAVRQSVARCVAPRCSGVRWDDVTISCCQSSLVERMKGIPTCVYSFTHIYMHICIHMYIYVYICTYNLRTHIHACSNICVYTYIYMHIYMYRCISIHVNIFGYICTYISWAKMWSLDSSVNVGLIKTPSRMAQPRWSSEDTL